MKNSKKLKIAAGSAFGIVFLLFAVTVVHIAVMVKNKKPVPNASIQMGRIDFSEQPGAPELKVLQSRIASIEGVKDSYYNEKTRILTYTFDARYNSAAGVYEDLSASEKQYAVRYVPSATEQAAGCPAGDQNSFYGKLTAAVERVVK